MKSLGLISCTKRKRNDRCSASEMYSASDLFRKAYAYAVKNYDVVATLSAKYGLLLPNDKIDTYNMTLSEMSSGEITEWSESVFKQMEKRLELSDFDKAFFHTGKKYRQYLIPKLEKLGIRCKVPLGNLGIGKQKAWYKAHDC